MAAQVEADLRVNGLTNGREGMEEEHENGHSPTDDHIHGILEPGQISPGSRRRSTRASALKAQEKIKLKEDFSLPGCTAQENGEESEEEETSPPDPAAKRRKLEDGRALDQFSHKFGIRFREGEVYMLSDESEISSLNEQDVEKLRSNYEKIKARELSEEEKTARVAMLREAEAELRLEEARLAMLRKVRQSVLNPPNVHNKVDVPKKLASSVPQNTLGSAYKPTVAAPSKNSHHSGQSTQNKAKTANSSNVKSNSGLLGLAGLTGQQIQELVRRAAQMDPGQAMQALLTLTKGQMGTSPQAAALYTAIQQKMQSASSSSTSTAAPSSIATHAPAVATSAPSTAASSFASQTPQQRAAAARQAFRRQADQQLAQIAVTPKAPPHGVNFIPNANQPDFCYLLGLDLVVQRMLKDKMVDRTVGEVPYECEECKTDFTPSWKVTGSSKDDLRLYCEACLRSKQKQKTRQDHTATMKKLFSKFVAQEKGFEQQIADGKLDAIIDAATKAQAAQSQQATQATSVPVSSVPQNLSTRAAPSSGSNTPQPTKSSTPLSSVAATPSSSKAAAAPSAPQSVKRSQTNANQMTQAAQMQAQMAALAQMARSNPMMAAMMQPMLSQAMTNPAMLQQIMQVGWNPMMMAATATMAAQQARLAQAAAAQAQPNMAAMNLLAQAVQNAGAQGSSSTSSAQQNPMVAQLAAAAAGMNPAALLASNPNLLRQVQQMQQMMNSSKAKK